MVDVDGLQRLRGAVVRGDARAVEQVAIELGKPSVEKIVRAALELTSSEDRNLRVLAVRILAYYPTPEACTGILQALSDPERRVREVAAKSAKPFLDKTEVADRLRAMVCDDSEKRKIRGKAFGTLSAPGEKLDFDRLPDSALTAIETLAESDKYRWPVLMGLLQMQLDDRVESLLKSFVKEGSREEAVLATRGLCGYRIVNIGKVQDETLKSRIRCECDIAVGRVFYWVRRSETRQEGAVCI